MTSVFFVSDDPGTMVQLADGLEAAGLHVRWIACKDAMPARQATSPDVVVLGGDANLTDLARAWKGVDPAPALLIWSDRPVADQAAKDLGLARLATKTDVRVLARELARAGDGRFVDALTRVGALHAIGAASARDAMKDNVAILTGARKLSLDKVKDALRMHADAYLTASSDLEALRQERALTIPEVHLVASIDGARTLRAVAQSGAMDPGGALRLIWALASAGIISLTAEPFDDAAHPAARRVARARRRLVARAAVVVRAQTHFDILEVSPDFKRAPGEVDAAIRQLAVWYAPESLAGLDLGGLAHTVAPYWQAIDKARATLIDPPTCQRYFTWLIERGIDLRPRMTEKAGRDLKAEHVFHAGQQALATGDAFGAVSHLAAAARIDPDHPDYEAFVAWARYQAEQARGGDARAHLAKDMAAVENMLSGRRPRPRALYALGLSAQVAGDTDLARLFFGESLQAEPGMAAAQRALARLQPGAAAPKAK